MKKIILCEKREAAEDLIFKSLFFGKGFAKKGFSYENDNFVFVWAAGHLFRQKEPSEINSEYELKFKIDPQFDYTIPQLEQEAGYIPDTVITKRNKANKSLIEFKKQILNQIKTTLSRNDYDEIVLAADADGEGERIHTDPLKYFWKSIPKGTKISRFWNTGSYRVQNAVKSAYENRKDISDNKYKYLLQSAKARSMSDYLVGMKLTKLLTDKTQGFFRCGRVLSVIVGMIGRREDEIKNFVPKDYWNIKGMVKDIQFNHFYIDTDIDDDGKEVKVHSTRYFIEDEMKKVLADIEAVKRKGKVIKVQKRTTSSIKPKLYSTDDFNSEFMSKYKVDLAYSNACLEWLRDEGYTSYPRTNGNFFKTEDFKVADTAIKISLEYFSEKLKNIAKTDKKYQEVLSNQSALQKNHPIFNDKKADTQNHTPLTIYKAVGKEDLDLFASAPTHKERKDGNGKPLKLKHLREAYELIATRHALQVLPDDEINKENITIEINTHQFETNAEQVTYSGWKQFDDNATQKSDKVINLFVKEGDDIVLDDVFSTASKTTCPKPYTQQTLLKALMKTTEALTEEFNNIEDPVVKKEKMKRFQQIKKILTSNNGVGTDATREKILEKPKIDGLIVFKGKDNTIELTELGRYQYQNTPEYLKSLETTAVWEQKLEDIRNGLFGYNDFIAMVDKSIAKIVQNTMQSQTIAINSFKGKGNGKPTDKQLQLVKKISQTLNITVKKEEISSISSVSDFINKHKEAFLEKAQSGRTLSDKQITYILNNADGNTEIIALAKKKTISNDEYKKIEAFFKSNRSNQTYSISEKQMKLLKDEKNAKYIDADTSKIMQKENGTLTYDEMKKVNSTIQKIFDSFRK